MKWRPETRRPGRSPSRRPCRDGTGRRPRRRNLGAAPGTGGAATVQGSLPGPLSWPQRRADRNSAAARAARASGCTRPGPFPTCSAASRSVRRRGNAASCRSRLGVRPLSFDFNDGDARREGRPLRVRLECTASERRGRGHAVRVRGAGGHAGHRLRAGRDARGARGGPSRRLPDPDRRAAPGVPLLARRPRDGRDAVRPVRGSGLGNQRDGSTRVTKVWHAPALGYLPVQAVQYRKGRPEVQMRLLSLESALAIERVNRREDPAPRTR